MCQLHPAEIHIFGAASAAGGAQSPVGSSPGAERSRSSTRPPGRRAGGPRPLGSVFDATGDRRRTLAPRASVAWEAPIYNLPVIIIAFVFIVIFAVLTELPLWMVGLAAVLAVIGYFIERRRPS